MAVRVARLGGQLFSALVSELEPVTAEELVRISSEYVRALQGELTRTLLRQRLRSVEPEELGTLYEGTLGFALELARQPTVVMKVRRKPGRAELDIALDLTALGALAGTERLRRLEELGVSLGAEGPAVAGASGGEELRRRLTVLRGAVSVPLGHYYLRRNGGRRRSGSHYTPRALAGAVVERTLAPLLAKNSHPEAILELRVCDPAMGSGAFLVAVCRFLGERLASTWGDPASTQALLRARRLVAEHCLFGIDRDPLAVEVARLALARVLEHGEERVAVLEERLVVGDALSSNGSLQEVCDLRGGFDAFVGNPPWISYAGRAAQPLEPERRADFAARYRAFAGYRNLQGLFVERCAEALRPGGRLGLLLPSSMSELGGYAPTRRAHDRLCVADPVLPDLGEDAFDGVFQPCMVLLSTRRATPARDERGGPWRVERPDLDRTALDLLEKLAVAPLPPHLFGERGVQSTGDDAPHLAREPSTAHSVPLRSGSDVEAFRLAAPSFHADPRWFGERLRSRAAWSEVDFVVRQTARVPIAALSDGTAFRNSLLAGFEDDAYSAAFLVAYLNSSPIRWLHFVRHRDARQGMPQLKVGHLRATPAPPHRKLVAELGSAGKQLSERNRGVGAAEQETLDRAVADAFGLAQREWEKVRVWARSLRT